MKPRLAISFSGGRTSAVMTKLCLERYRESHDIVGMALTQDFDLFTDDRQRAIYDAEIDVGASCGESCEIGADL